MADPTATVGASKENSLDVATRGGPKFMARLEQLAEATDKYEAAFANLRIGQDAQAALAQAQQKLAEADALRTKAAKTLAEAEHKLADAAANAKAQAAEADRIVANANVVQRTADKRLKQVEAREQAATEAIAKAERAEAGANQVREDLQGRTDRLLREIANIEGGDHVGAH
jgi:chromosome segregation ATPase